MKILREGWSFHERLEYARLNKCKAEVGNKINELKSWERIISPDDPAGLEKRLLWDELSKEQAFWALNPPDSVVPKSPEWWAILQNIRKSALPSETSNLSTEKDSIRAHCFDYAFIDAWLPASIWGLKELQNKCPEVGDRSFLSSEALLDLADYFLHRICSATEQALWELFKMRQTPGMILLNHFHNPSKSGSAPPCSLYREFIYDLLSSGYSELLATFPVLGRVIATVAQNWLDSCHELISRIILDRDALAQKFDIPREASIRRINIKGLSDPHRGGRSVAMLEFCDAINSSIRVAYKPKSLALDNEYYQLISDLNQLSSLPFLRTIKILCRDSYGYMEWVDHVLCEDEPQLKKFYNSAGRIVGILFLLGCTDCHYENLIANQDQLLLLDTETILEGNQNRSPEASGSTDVSSSLLESLDGSVIDTGLLPHWLLGPPGSKEAIDISALGVEPPPDKRSISGWQWVNTDWMTYGTKNIKPPLPTSLPVGHKSKPVVSDYVDDICCGFTAQLKELARLASRIKFFLARCSLLRRRVIARPTRFYSIIQRQLVSPSSLRSAVGRGLVLEQLTRCFCLLTQRPPNWRLFHAELFQMEALDIPYFEHDIGSHDLILHNSLDRVEDFISGCGVTSTLRRLEYLDESHIQFQESLIRGTFSARFMTMCRPEGSTLVSSLISPSPERLWDTDVLCQQSENEAKFLLDYLWNFANLNQQGLPDWLSMNLAEDGISFNFGLINDSLYSGRCGISLAFLRFSQLVASDADSKCWMERAWMAIYPLRVRVDHPDESVLKRYIRDRPLGLSGIGGWLLLLQLFSRNGWFEADHYQKEIVRHIDAERLRNDEDLDILFGISGLIGPLLSSNESSALQLARLCGDRLVDAQLTNGGWACKRLSSPNQIVTLNGFSHGVAGIAASLAKLAQVTQDTKYVGAAIKGVNYESSLYDDIEKNWPDYRFSLVKPQFKSGWCHGAPGILLSLQILKTAGITNEIIESNLQRARSSTIERLQIVAGDKNAQSHLCCGVFGLTSLLRIDARLSGFELPNIVANVESACIVSASQGVGYKFFNVDSSSILVPGLFNGIAGLALALQEIYGGISLLPVVLSAGLLTDL